MKTYFKPVLSLLLGVMVIYTSCQKSETKPASSTTTTSSTPVAPTTTTANVGVVSGQIAVTLSQSFAGSFGGININNSLKPSALTSSYPSSSYSLCGFVADSVLNYYTNVGDTIKSHTVGNNKFYFDCLNGQPNGYTAYDTTVTAGTGPKYTFIYKIDQYYRIYVCGCGILTVNGNQKAFIDYNYNDRTKSYYAHNTYILNNLNIDLHKNADITSGTATFTSVGVNVYGTWNLTGTITYIGNHQAQVTVNGVTTVVNIATGQVVV